MDFLGRTNRPTYTPAGARGSLRLPTRMIPTYRVSLFRIGLQRRFRVTLWEVGLFVFALRRIGRHWLASVVGARSSAKIRSATCSSLRPVRWLASHPNSRSQGCCSRHAPRLCPHPQRPHGRPDLDLDPSLRDIRRLADIWAPGGLRGCPRPGMFRSLLSCAAPVSVLTRILLPASRKRGRFLRPARSSSKEVVCCGLVGQWGQAGLPLPLLRSQPHHEPHYREVAVPLFLRLWCFFFSFFRWRFPQGSVAPMPGCVHAQLAVGVDLLFWYFGEGSCLFFQIVHVCLSVRGERAASWGSCIHVGDALTLASCSFAPDLGLCCR